MPGYQRIIYGRPPAPPHLCALCSGQESTADIEYFIETGIFSEDIGVVYLCNKCFEPLVLLSEKYIFKVDHEAEILATKTLLESTSRELDNLHNQAELLHEFAGLRLADLSKFRDLSKQLDSLVSSVGALEAEKNQRSTSKLIFDQEIVERERQLLDINAQIEAQKAELNIFIAESLSMKLGRIGRADLIPILLNGELPDPLQRASNDDEHEIDVHPGIENFSFANPNGV